MVITELRTAENDMGGLNLWGGLFAMLTLHVESATALCCLQVPVTSGVIVNNYFSVSQGLTIQKALCMEAKGTLYHTC